MSNEKEFKVKFLNDNLILSDDAIHFLKSKNIHSLKIKISPDLDEICRIERISKKSVEKIAAVQRIPIEIALDVIRCKGKLQK
jgi:hypothetical protein